MLRRAELQIAEIIQETHDTKTFRVGAPPGGLPEFKPGQFYAFEVKNADGAWIRRSYSIASSPRETRFFDLTIKFLEGGAATGVLFKNARTGDTVRATGPFGEFILDESRPAIFVAGGVGITPIMSMLRYWSESVNPPNACLLYSNRERRDIIYEAELRDMAAKCRNFEFHYSLTRVKDGDRWGGRVGRFDASVVNEICQNMTDRIIYLCGPVAMMEEMGRSFIDMGVKSTDIRVEAFLGTNPTFG